MFHSGLLLYWVSHGHAGFHPGLVLKTIDEDDG
jgi:hypothetical protein